MHPNMRMRASSTCCPFLRIGPNTTSDVHTTQHQRKRQRRSTRQEARCCHDVRRLFPLGISCCLCSSRREREKATKLKCVSFSESCSISASCSSVSITSEARVAVGTHHMQHRRICHFSTSAGGVLVSHRGTPMWTSPIALRRLAIDQAHGISCQRHSFSGEYPFPSTFKQR